MENNQGNTSCSDFEGLNANTVTSVFAFSQFVHL